MKPLSLATSSTATFNAPKSQYAARLELHRSSQPSSEGIRYTRRFEDELHSDAKDTLLPWTPQECDLMMPARIELQTKYKTNKEWREDLFKGSSDGLEKRPTSRVASLDGTEAEGRRRKDPIAAAERYMAVVAAARKKKKEHDEWEAQHRRFLGRETNYCSNPGSHLSCLIRQHLDKWGQDGLGLRNRK